MLRQALQRFAPSCTKFRDFAMLNSQINKRTLSTSCQLGQKHTGGMLDYDFKFKQVTIPDVEKEFKGLETDFPCLAKHDFSGLDPVYTQVLTGYKTYVHNEPFELKYGGVLPQVELAYETWGQLNPDRNNVILLWTGLSASQHAKSHEDNPDPGWWEKFIGPGCAIDTDKFFVICVNNLGSCFGTTGPSSINLITQKPYATTFPMISVEDMTRATFLLLDHLKISKIYGSVGSSLGGMLSLVSSVLFPDRIGKVVSISSCVRSHPVSIAMRYMQRKAIMLDPKWNKGHYYDTDEYPRMGVKIAREIATMTYRSGLEWEQRFGRAKVDEDALPSLCPHFLIENYLDYQGENYVSKIDANTILYISKAMDLFDLSETWGTMEAALERVKCPVLVIGAQTDILFPIWQQREIVNELQKAGNNAVTYYELNSVYGHDTFLLDLNGVGTGVKGFLETDNKNKGRARKRKDKK